MLHGIWRTKRWKQTYTTLASPDIDVTNAADKAQQLLKIPALNGVVRRIMAVVMLQLAMRRKRQLQHWKKRSKKDLLGPPAVSMQTSACQSDASKDMPPSKRVSKKGYGGVASRGSRQVKEATIELDC